MALPKFLDDLIVKRIVDAVRDGASRTAAAESARVGRSTLHVWLRRGSEGEEPYASFAARVREAEAEFEKELVAVVKKHSVNSYQAACWLLERKYPQRWALRRDRPEHEAPLTKEETDRLLAEAADLHAHANSLENKQ